MAGGWLLVVLGLCLAMVPSCAGESGGYSLQLGLTLTQGYFPNNTYIVNITRDGGRVEEYKGYRHGAVFSRVSVKAIDGENMPVGTFVELLYSSMRTCTEMSRTGAQVLEGTDCPNLLFPLTLTWKAPMWDVGKINFMATISPYKKGPYQLTSSTVEPLPLPEKNAIPSVLMRDHAYFVVVPVNQSVALGEPATFHCEAVAEATTHISITWAFHNGRDIPLPYHSRHRLDPDTRDLTILAVEEGDLGRYTCQVSTDNWNTKYLQHAWLSKYVKPRITTNMEDQEVRKGERMTLACQATGTPPPAYTWLYRNEDVRQLGSRYTVRDGTLEVQPIQVEDFGRYTCRAENLLGGDEAGTDLDVLYPPEIEDQNLSHPEKSVERNEGRTSDVLCSREPNS
ncbi:roundabout homolog 1-like [Branchiostoma floridae x Branchiostoma japonicum]